MGPDSDRVVAVGLFDSARRQLHETRLHLIAEEIAKIETKERELHRRWEQLRVEKRQLERQLEKEGT
jgi:hypothetical protein